MFRLRRVPTAYPVLPKNCTKALPFWVKSYVTCIVILYVNHDWVIRSLWIFVLSPNSTVAPFFYISSERRLSGFFSRKFMWVAVLIKYYRDLFRFVCLFRRVSLHKDNLCTCYLGFLRSSKATAIALMENHTTLNLKWSRKM